MLALSVQKIKKKTNLIVNRVCTDNYAKRNGCVFNIKQFQMQIILEIFNFRSKFLYAVVEHNHKILKCSSFLAARDIQYFSNDVHCNITRRGIKQKVNV